MKAAADRSTDVELCALSNRGACKLLPPARLHSRKHLPTFHLSRQVFSLYPVGAGKVIASGPGATPTMQWAHRLRG